MATVYRRGKKLYARIKNGAGKWASLRTGHSVGQERLAQQWADQLERGSASQREMDGPATLARYARLWLSRRKTKTVKDDRTRLELHALPRVGDVPLAEFRPRHVRDLILELRAEGKLAPRTIRQVAGVLHAVFQSAFIDELVPANPIKFERGVLPPKIDKDPRWRHQAIFTRAEGEQLISDERLLPDRRVLYALKFLAMLRHGEAARLTWEEWDAAARPLGMIQLGETKSKYPRQIPVHPTLARVLATWKLGGWMATYGRAPSPTDLIVPARTMRVRAPAGAQVQLLEDLTRLGLRTEAGKTRNRRGHDLRRTAITLARTDGAIDSILRWISHGPRGNEMLDVYSSPPWDALCGEMAKLRVELREGKVIALAIAP